MSILKNMKLATMLGAGFAIVLVISFFVSGYGQLELRQQGNTINTLASDQLEGLLLVQELKDNLNSTAIAVRNLTLFTTHDQVEQAKQRINQNSARNNEILKRIGELASTPKEKSLLDAINQVRPINQAATQKTIALSLNNKLDEAKTVIMDEVKPAQDNYFKAINAMVSYQKSDTRQSADVPAQRHAPPVS